LLRSLNKLKRLEGDGFAFSDDDWSLLVRIYNAA